MANYSLVGRPFINTITLGDAANPSTIESKAVTYLFLILSKIARVYAVHTPAVPILKPSSDAAALERCIAQWVTICGLAGSSLASKGI